MNKTLSTICYVGSGFFMYIMMLISFYGEIQMSGKLTIMGVFTVPAVGALALGFTNSQPAHRQRDAGIVCLSAALFVVFLVISVASMLATPELTEMYPENPVDAFDDYTMGFLSIGAFACIGSWLLWQHRRASAKATGQSEGPE